MIFVLKKNTFYTSGSEYTNKLKILNDGCD